MNLKLRNIPFSPPDMSEAEVQEVSEALRSGWITTGPRTKEFERVLFSMAGIEHYELIFTRFVVIFVKSEKFIDSYVWVHASHSVEKYVRTLVVILNIDMVDDTLMQVSHKFRTVSISCQCILYVLSS